MRNNVVALRQFVIDLGPRSDGFGTFTTAAPTANPGSVFRAHEETIAGYAQVNYKLGDTIDGSVGVRAINTDLSVNGNALVAGVVTPIDRGQGFLDILPNASVRWKILQPVQMRLSFSQTRTKPSFAQLNPSVNVGPPDLNNGGLRSGSGGNPDLKPYKSNNYDASLEYYFSRTGFASVAYFHRNISDFIQNQSVRFTDPQLGLLEITRPVNANSTRIDGFEAQVSTFFDVAGLPDFFRSFGVQANYTYLDTNSKLAIPGPAGVFLSSRIFGIAHHTYNIAGLFERGPLSMRLTYNKRSTFLDQVGFRGASDTFLQYGKPPGRVDLSMNLAFAKNATLFFDATNITGEPFEYRFSSARDGAPRADFVRFLRYDEQTFSVGLRFRL